MKHLKLFEDWSPNFNRTLQGAYDQAKTPKKGFGKAAKVVMDYANRSISKKVFTIETTKGNKVEIVHNPEFILQPIQTFIKYNGELSKDEWEKDKGYIVLPVQLSIEELAKRSFNKKDTEFEQEALVKRDFDLIFKDEKIYAKATSRTSSNLPTPEDELRFLDRKSIEDFFAMTIQAVLSSPEKVSQPSAFRFRKPNPSLPGDTVEKQIILKLIQKLILDKDQRLYTM
jgi:hypothetical protein